MMKRILNSNKLYVVGIVLFTVALLTNAMNSVNVDSVALLKQMSYSDTTVRKTVTEKNVSIMRLSNDPFSDTQWYIDNPGQYSNLAEVMKRYILSTEDVDMDIVEAWDEMENSNLLNREVVVAVIDTGVDYQHPDLTQNMWVNDGEIPGDKKDNDNNGYVDDIYGWDFYHDDDTVCHYSYSERFNKYVANPEDNDNHGTHVAGIIAAALNNEIGIAGIASNISIKIMSLKINGGKEGTGNASDAIEAIKYASKMGADICNLSWGTTKYDASLEEIMKESDMLFVAAVGNDGTNIDAKPMYPASLELDNLIAVTFIDADGDLTDYSNVGKNTVDLAAPGKDIFSTIVGSYGSMSGSSMAAPQVSAVAAMLYAQHDYLFASNVKEVITSSIKEIKGLEGYMVYGGIPSAYQAIMNSGALIQDTHAPELSFETTYNKGDMAVRIKVANPGASDLRVIKWIYGSKTVKDFWNGFNGTSVVNSEVDLSKAGTYTFYAADYAGNEVAQTYEVVADEKAPKLTMMYSVANDYKSRTITVIASDGQSGIKRVEYLPGIKTAEDFLPADVGTEVKVKDGKGKFKVKKDGIYSVFVTDNRGNMVVKQIKVKTVKATEFKLLNISKTLGPGDLFTLRTYIMPGGSTDKLTYISTNEKVAVVSPTGKVTAIKEGKAYITVTTSSGLSASCLITVNRKN